MWTLRHSSGCLIHIPPDISIIIGRKSGDLILNDKSVSYLHAKISVKRHHDDNSDDNDKCKLSSTCIISDEGSRRGTKITRRKEISLPPYTDYKLKPNDKINFGANNVWTVSYIKISLLTCGDCVDHIQKLKKIIKTIGGEIFTEWNESCNYYTTLCERITPKFVTALVAELPFVTLKYWEEFYKCYQSRKKLPDPSKYSLKNWNYSDELKNVLLHPVYARKNIFNGLEFVFFSLHQIDVYAQMIELAGGRPLMCAKYGFKGKHLLSDNTIIISCDEHERISNNCCGLSDSGYRDIRRLLAKEKRKMIDETEIVKAILLCSRDKYCKTGLHKRRNFKNSQETYNPQNLDQKCVESTVQVGTCINKQNKENLPDPILKVPSIKSRQSSKENLIQDCESNTIQSVSHPKVQTKKIFNTSLEDSTVPISIVPSKENPQSSNENVIQDHENNVINIVSDTNEQNKTDFDILPENSITLTKKDFKEKSDEIQWINVDKNKEKQIKSTSTSPANVKLSIAVVELEKLSDSLISTLTNNCNKQQGDLSKKSGDRKRKNTSSDTSTNLDSTLDLFASDDESPVKKRLNKSSPDDQIKIIDDQLITSKIILRTPNRNSKRRKIEQKTIASWLNVTNNEAKTNVKENLDKVIQSDCNKNKFSDLQPSSVIIINDDNHNNKKILNNQVSTDIQLLVNQKTQSSDDKEKLDSKKRSKISDDSLNFEIGVPSTRRKSKRYLNKTVVNYTSDIQSQIVPDQNNKNLRTPRKLKSLKEINNRESSGDEIYNIPESINEILLDKNVTIIQNNCKSNTNKNNIIDKNSPSEDCNTEYIRPVRIIQFSSLFDDDKKLTSSKDRGTMNNTQKQSSNQHGLTKIGKNKDTGENAVPSFLKQSKEKISNINEIPKKLTSQASSNSCDNLDGEVIEILDDFEKNMFNDNELESLTTQNNNQNKTVQNKPSLKKWQKGENAIPAFFMK